MLEIILTPQTKEKNKKSGILISRTAIKIGLFFI